MRPSRRRSAALGPRRAKPKPPRQRAPSAARRVSGFIREKSGGAAGGESCVRDTETHYRVATRSGSDGTVSRSGIAKGEAKTHAWAKCVGLTTISGRDAAARPPVPPTVGWGSLPIGGAGVRRARRAGRPGEPWDGPSRGGGSVCRGARGRECAHGRGRRGWAGARASPVGDGGYEIVCDGENLRAGGGACVRAEE